MPRTSSSRRMRYSTSPSLTSEPAYRPTRTSSPCRLPEVRACRSRELVPSLRRRPSRSWVSLLRCRGQSVLRFSARPLQFGEQRYDLQRSNLHFPPRWGREGVKRGGPSGPSDTRFGTVAGASSGSSGPTSFRIVPANIAEKRRLRSTQPSSFRVQWFLQLISCLLVLPRLVESSNNLIQFRLSDECLVDVTSIG